MEEVELTPTSVLTGAIEPNFTKVRYDSSVVLITPWQSAETDDPAALAWDESVSADLARFERRGPNWDGEGAFPLSRTHGNRAMQFLRAVMTPSSLPPEMSALSDGGIQLEWHLPDMQRIDFVSDEETNGPVVMIEAEGELTTTPIAEVDLLSIKLRLARSPYVSA